MKRFQDLVVQHPVALLVVIGIGTLLLGLPARHLKTDSSVDTLLPRTDPARQFYREVREQFGSDEVGIVAVLADDVFAPEVLETIRRLTHALEDVDGVDGTLSLTNAPNPMEDVLSPPPLIGRIPETAHQRQEILDRLGELPVYVKNLVNAEGSAAAINIFFEEMSDDEFLDRGVDRAILRVVDEADTDHVRVVYSGLPHLKAYSTRAMQQDLRRLVPLTLAVIALVLLVSFRSVRGVLVPVVTVALALIWTSGFMVLTGGRLSLASTALPPLILVLGSVYSLHVLSEYFEVVGEGDREAAIRHTLTKTTPPVFIAALTTMLGFLSLTVNPIVGIRSMGLYSSLGIFLAFVLSVVFVPAVLVLLPPPRATRRETFAPAVGSALRSLGRFDVRYRKTILVVSAAIGLWAVWHARDIRVDSNFQSFFPEDSPVRAATEAINTHLAGAMLFHVVVDGDEPGIMKDLDTLERIDQLQRFIDGLPGIHKTVSLVDYVELLDKANQSSQDLRVTESGELVRGGSGKTFWEEPSQLGSVFEMMALEPQSFSRIVTPDFSRSDILVRTSLARASEVERVVEQIREYARKTFPPELEAIPTGTLVLHTKTTANVVRGQIQSLGLAAVVIFAIMAGMFLSVRVGLVAMLPNLFPILFFFGLLGVTGAILSLATSIIAAIVLGIAVDDTVHVMTRLSAEVRATGDQAVALDRTLDTVGKPVVFSTIFLVLGFLVLCLSSFVPVREFGWLSAATISVALLADLMLLPAMIATMRIITLWDLLYVALGKDPHKTIPLFATLRPFQAKIVTLMGQLKSFPKDSPIVRQGQMGSEMYVIINGSADVVVHLDGGATRQVRTLQRGEVFGEMGLIRHHERTADVIAAEDVDVMAMDENFLDRVQRRYPRIATKIFLNVARILSDRLQTETRRGT